MGGALSAGRLAGKARRSAGRRLVLFVGARRRRRGGDGLIDRRETLCSRGSCNNWSSGASQADAFRDVYGTDARGAATRRSTGSRRPHSRTIERLNPKAGSPDGRRDCDRRRRDRSVGRARIGRAGGGRHCARAGGLRPRGEVGRRGHPAPRQSRRRDDARIASPPSVTPSGPTGPSRWPPRRGSKPVTHGVEDWSCAWGADEGRINCRTKSARGARKASGSRPSAWRRGEFEPLVAPEIAGAYRLPDLGQVRNPRLIKALLAACGARGVRLLPGTPVVALDGREAADRRRPHATGSCKRADIWWRVAPGRGAAVVGRRRRGDQPRPWPDRARLAELETAHARPADRAALYRAPRRRPHLDRRDRRARGLREGEHSVGRQRAVGVWRQPGARAGEARFERAWSGLRPGRGTAFPT